MPAVVVGRHLVAPLRPSHGVDEPVAGRRPEIGEDLRRVLDPTLGKALKVEKARKKAEKLAKKTLNLSTEEEQKDALGNTIVKAKEEGPVELTKKERKELMKQRKQMVKNGEDTYDIDLKLGMFED